MTVKIWLIWRILALECLVFRMGRAGVIPIEEEPHVHVQEEPSIHDHHISVANSYMHFHGPVEGPEFEFKVPYVPLHHDHNHLSAEDESSKEHDDFHYTVDYVAHPKYEYSYGVEDHHTGDFHSQKETREGHRVTGEYSVMEPGGNLRIVTYHADKDGFHAHVHNSGKNDHSGATYSHEAQHHETVHHPQLHHEIPSHHEASGGHELHGYAAAFSNHEGY